ncbi:DUF6959 family protein [Streptomyces virginiae]|uniref:DUF6959 family protein n=1 Tax=Streptomyces virginiae TaxID=1961 RepID=UPI00368B7515
MRLHPDPCRKATRGTGPGPRSRDAVRPGPPPPPTGALRRRPHPGSDTGVCLPPHRFPRVLIQGDSLSIIRSDVAEIVEACAQGDVDGAHEAATLLLASIDELLDRYESALRVHGLERPYAPRT